MLSMQKAKVLPLALGLKIKLCAKSNNFLLLLFCRELPQNNFNNELF